jgi:hypothetical protein
MQLRQCLVGCIKLVLYEMVQDLTWSGVCLGG